MGMLFITHNLSIVRQLADRVAVMQERPLRRTKRLPGSVSGANAPVYRRLLDSEPAGKPVPLPPTRPSYCRPAILMSPSNPQRDHCAGWSITIEWSTI